MYEDNKQLFPIGQRVYAVQNLNDAGITIGDTGTVKGYRDRLVYIEYDKEICPGRERNYCKTGHGSAIFISSAHEYIRPTGEDKITKLLKLQEEANNA